MKISTEKIGQCAPLRDLNPIVDEHNILERRYSPENTKQVKKMHIEEWELLPQKRLYSLILLHGNAVMDIMYSNYAGIFRMTMHHVTHPKSLANGCGAVWTMVRPPRSPDINPIEYIWDRTERSDGEQSLSLLLAFLQIQTAAEGENILQGASDDFLSQCH
ncbi:hypothetical protein TNCV_4797011 [Trichonephila clavipes]|nr:hypothetical protein TNCV_4797011 [Trichonephila clavipes]